LKILVSVLLHNAINSASGHHFFPFIENPRVTSFISSGCTMTISWRDSIPLRAPLLLSA